MKKSKKLVTIISFALAFITAFYFTGCSYTASEQKIRTVTLQEYNIDYQAILDEFEDAELVIEDNFADFVGYQSIDPILFEEIDNISLEDKKELQENNRVRYHFTYDSESNVVTIEAEMQLSDGSIIMDEIHGVGFYNEKGEIDAVMNIDGEGILLSEMRDAGLIQNCGWLSNLVKAVAVATVIVAAVVVVAAAVVVTAGAAAPALVAAGVGVTTATVTAAAATAATIGTYAALTAAIAAGVYITVAMVENIEFQGIKYKAEELTETKIKALPTANYHIALATSDGKMVFCAVPITRYLAITIMQNNTLISFYTFLEPNARSVAQEASYHKSPIREGAHGKGYFDHYHTSTHGNAHAFFGLPVF